jgi:hypothetical protein
VFATVLTGAKGKALKEKYLDNLWCFSGQLATSGHEYAAHFGQVWQTDPDVAHQGGYFGTLNLAGEKRIDNQWTVSHSLDQQVIFHRGSFITLSLGDTFPKGLWFENRTLGFGRVIFPNPDVLQAWKPGHARLGSLFSAGQNMGMVFASPVKQSRELFYMVARDDGHVLRTTQLTDTPEVDEQVVKAASLGEHLLVVWREGQAQANVRIMNIRGKWLTEPKLLEYSIPQNHDLVRLPGGDVAWLVAEDGAKEVTLVRVRETK